MLTVYSEKNTCIVFLAESIFFFFNDTATTEIYTLSLHDALPIFQQGAKPALSAADVLEELGIPVPDSPGHVGRRQDRKSTRLNSSHGYISYAVFCLKKKKECFG